MFGYHAPEGEFFSPSAIAGEWTAGPVADGLGIQPHHMLPGPPVQLAGHGQAAAGLQPFEAGGASFIVPACHGNGRHAVIVVPQGQQHALRKVQVHVLLAGGDGLHRLKKRAQRLGRAMVDVRLARGSPSPYR